MAIERPEFLLFAEAESNDTDGRWHFSLESNAGEPLVTATDVESFAPVSRLELLAVVRGLEALDQPSQVTLITRSAYVHRGIRFGLEEWRYTKWRWERFGRLVPVTNADLWQRLDQAMQIHSVKCRSLRVELLHSAHVLRGPHFSRSRSKPALLAREIHKQAS